MKRITCARKFHINYKKLKVQLKPLIHFLISKHDTNEENIHITNSLYMYMYIYQMYIPVINIYFIQTTNSE